MKHIARSFALMALAMASCNRPPDPTPGAAAPLPAFEYFETLTEDAFTASPQDIDATIARARTALDRERPGLPATAAAAVDERLAAVIAARDGLDRSAIALSAVEGFRILAEAAPSTPQAPAEVSLLDYAGFRYGADLKSMPARWDDATAAAAFGSGQWARISSRVTDAGLKRRVDQALSDMSEAARSHDPGRAETAALRELDLVDALEVYFARS